tara:strand:- start:460 stop:1605 length:1146 start_codon:yes stop_codon:yes gene_type:complete
MNKRINNSTKFTIHDNQDIYHRISSDLDLITQIILNKFTNIESIVLAGGFGRGEGSVLIVDNDIQPINDYDIYIITKNNSEIVDLEDLRNSFLKRVQIRQVDIELIQAKKLKYLKPTMANYDLKYASYVFYGNKKILESIPLIDSSKLSLREGRTPLLLYLISILQAYPGEKDSQITDNEKFWIYQQISKSILGWSSALLILHGKYHSSYIERENFFKQTFNNKVWCELVQKATQFKVSPFLDIKEDLYSLWYLNKQEHMKVLMLFLSQYYNKQYNDWDTIIKDYRNDYENIVRKIFGWLMNKKRYKDRINLTVIELLVLLAKSENNIDEKLLKTINNELNKFNNNGNNNYSWELARKFCIDNDPNCKIWKERGSSIFYDL